MQNKERCKRNRKKELHAAALNVPKLGSFGFKKITQESVQDSDTYSEASQLLCLQALQAVSLYVAHKVVYTRQHLSSRRAQMGNIDSFQYRFFPSMRG